MRIVIISVTTMLVVVAITLWVKKDNSPSRKPTVIQVNSEEEAKKLVAAAGGVLQASVYGDGALPTNPPTYELRAVQDGKVFLYRWTVDDNQDGLKSAAPPKKSYVEL